MGAQSLPVVLFFLIFGMIVLGFFLIKMLLNRLESVHPRKFEAMGKPTPIMHRTIGGGWETFKFLVTREHKSLNDGYLSKLSDTTLLFFIIFVVVFLFGLFVSMGMPIGHAT